MNPTSKRCLRCFRPHRLCYCDDIERIDHRTSLVILQHRRERFHPFNTARIVSESLRNCELLVAYNHELSEQFESLSLHDNVGLLYPGPQSALLSEALLSEVPLQRRPTQLVVLDGTWHQAKTLYRDIPRLHQLPQYRLAPSSPGRYRIRREPNEHALSTLEATAAALMALEPDNTELARLTHVFDRMIGDQIGKSKTNWRQNQRRRRGSANVPRVLAGDLSDIVVAYGEREPGQPVPIFWTAIRLGSGERFECAIESEAFADSNLMSHLRLDQSVSETAVTRREFRERWRAFLHDGDRLAIQNHGTAALLKTVDADFVPVVILKAVNVAASLKPDAEFAPRLEGSRASERLQSAVNFVYRLNSLPAKLSAESAG